MGLLNRTRVEAPVVVVDVRAAEKWARKSLLSRLLADLVNPDKAAYMKGQHRLWKQAGLDRAQPARKEFNPMLASHWLGRR